MAAIDKRPRMDTKQNINWKDRSQCSISFLTYLEMQGPREVLNWYMNIGLISACYECSKCGNFMKLVERKDVIDGYEWRCRKQGGETQHQVCRSVRNGSFISNSKLSMCDILRIIRLWFGRCASEFVMNEVNVTSHVVVDWFRFCREVCTFDIMNESVPIGGEEFTVEVVECHLSGITNEKEIWLIGGIERGTNRCFFRIIKDRTKDELLAIISEWVLPGSVVLSDCWNVYDCFSDKNFIKLSANNNLTFKKPGSSKNPNDNAIEPVWSAVKRFLHHNNNHVEEGFEFDSYLGEYLWRKKHFYSMKDDVFKSFLKAILNLCKPLGKDLNS